MTAYYNENNPKAAAWLNELIRERHIAPGVVDTRSIEDVTPNDLRGFKQCHFFAGIGVWSYSLRRAGWPDDRPVWTGSCPCQPFSAAGKGKGFADERHLWPAWHYLIEVEKPPIILGEQVASADGLEWLDLVLSDLEATDYAVGAVDLCAAGVGAPHIRQRLYWCAADGVDNTSRARLEGHGRGSEAESGRDGAFRSTSEASEFGGLADGAGGGWREERSDAGGISARDREEGVAAGPIRGFGDSRVADDLLQHRPDGQSGKSTEHSTLGRIESSATIAGLRSNSGAGPTNGFWRSADWLYCRDAKWRPVEPGTFPLAHGAPARVELLRGYGNAIVAPVAEEFICAVMMSINAIEGA